jgi:hypothetical protein
LKHEAGGVDPQMDAVEELLRKGLATRKGPKGQ